MRSPSHLGALLLVALPIVASAQQTSSGADARSVGNNVYSCNTFSTQTGSNSASCFAAFPGGTVKLSTSGNNAQRRVSANGSLTQTGPLGSVEEVAETWSQQFSSIAVN